MLPISIKNERRKKMRKREGNRGREKIGKRKEKKKIQMSKQLLCFSIFPSEFIFRIPRGTDSGQRRAIRRGR